MTVSLTAVEVIARVSDYIPYKKEYNNLTMAKSQSICVNKRARLDHMFDFLYQLIN